MAAPKAPSALSRKFSFNGEDHLAYDVSVVPVHSVRTVDFFSATTDLAVEALGSANPFIAAGIRELLKKEGNYWVQGIKPTKPGYIHLAHAARYAVDNDQNSAWHRISATGGQFRFKLDRPSIRDGKNEIKCGLIWVSRHPNFDRQRTAEIDALVSYGRALVRHLKIG